MAPMPSKLAVAPTRRVPLQHSIKSAHIFTTQMTTATTVTMAIAAMASGQWLPHISTTAAAGVDATAAMIHVKIVWVVLGFD